MRELFDELSMVDVEPSEEHDDTHKGIGWEQKWNPLSAVWAEHTSVKFPMTTSTTANMVEKRSARQDQLSAPFLIDFGYAHKLLDQLGEDRVEDLTTDWRGGCWISLIIEGKNGLSKRIFYWIGTKGTGCSRSNPQTGGAE